MEGGEANETNLFENLGMEGFRDIDSSAGLGVRKTAEEGFHQYRGMEPLQFDSRETIEALENTGRADGTLELGSIEASEKAEFHLRSRWVKQSPGLFLKEGAIVLPPACRRLDISCYLDKPARLTIRVLWFLFLIVKSEVKANRETVPLSREFTRSAVAGNQTRERPSCFYENLPMFIRFVPDVLQCDPSHLSALICCYMETYHDRGFT